MSRNTIKAIIYAFLAAVFYAINVPLSKLLLAHMEPTLMAGLLYLGAGIGIGAMSLFREKGTKQADRLTKKDLPYVVGMIVLDIAAPIFLMFGLYSDLGIFYFVWMIFIVIASDSGGYFVGKVFGRIEFSKSSPNKTLEGVIGGFVFALIVSTAYAKIFTNLELKEILATTVVVSVFGVFGDLFESYLKRRANIKDSGTLFPGHGGMLDRIDGYLFGAIAMFLIYSW